MPENTEMESRGALQLEEATIARVKERAVELKEETLALQVRQEPICRQEREAGEERKKKKEKRENL